MSTISIIQNPPSGWNDWHFIRLNRKGTLVPHAPLPPRYLPASTLWIHSFNGHCRIMVPWIIGVDPFSTFIMGGGSSGTLGGSFVGLAAASLQMTFATQTMYAIGAQNPPIAVGYCIGDLYAELAYFRAFIAQGPPMNYNLNMDVFHRCRLKRYILHHGIVQRYEARHLPNDEIQYILTLDFPSMNFDENISIRNIRIISQDGGSTINVSVEEILPTFQLVISELSDNEVIKSGDFYILNTPIIIEDPFLLSGFWLGLENDNPGLDSSGYNLPVTSNNIFYLEIKFSGYYVLKNLKNGEIIAATHGSSMYNIGDYSWVWINGNNESIIYRDEENRFVEELELVTESIDDDEEEEYETYVLKERETGNRSDLSEWKNLNNFYRLEINIGGDRNRNNWHSSILRRGWLRQNGNYYKILTHPDGNVIDVSIKDVKNENELNIDSSCEILNQYGWKITEHLSSNIGFAGGEPSLSNNKITIDKNDRPESIGTMVHGVTRTDFDFNYLETNSFFERYMNDDCPSGNWEKGFKKYQGWRLIDSFNINLEIKDISYRHNEGDEVEIEVEIEVDEDYLSNAVIENLHSSPLTWVVFDTPFQKINRTLNAPLWTGALHEGGQNLCIDMSFLNSPIELDVPSGSSIGVCAGSWWGAGNVGVFNGNFAPLFVTTLSNNSCISGFYHPVFHESWIIYKDYLTRRMTARKGSFNFRDNAAKIEISFGLPEEIEDNLSFPIDLDTDYDRLKLLLMEMPESESGSSTFGIGNMEDWYGFFINGGGEVDFQLLRRRGMMPDELDSSMFQYQGNIVSPIPVEHKRINAAYERSVLHIGMSTEDGPIYARGNNVPTNISAYYVNDVQSIPGIKNFTSHISNHGEILIIYSCNVNEILLDGSKYNSSEEDNLWSGFNSGVFILGSSENGYMWNCPCVHELNLEENEDDQWPLMIMHSVEFIDSYYCSNTDNLYILTLNRDKSDYMGLFVVKLARLYHEDLSLFTSKRENSNEYEDKFLWRHPELRNSSPKWAEGHLLTDNSRSSKSDHFIRVAGNEENDTMIDIEVNQWQFSQIDIDRNGILRILLDYEGGIKMIYSTNSGFTFHLSDLILAKNAMAGLIIDDCLFYINEFGINVKHLSYSIFNKIYKGNEDDLSELQENLDDAENTIIGTGRINPQRFYGRVDARGIISIYYYDIDGKLSSISSENSYSWKMSPNF